LIRLDRKKEKSPWIRPFRSVHWPTLVGIPQFRPPRSHPSDVPSLVGCISPPVAIQAVLPAILCNSGVLCMRKDRSLPSQKCVGIFRFSCLFCIPSHRAIVVGTTNWLLTYDLQLRDLLLLGLIRSMESNWRQRRVAAVFAFHSHIYKDIACTTLHSIPFQHSQFGSCG